MTNEAKWLTAIGGIVSALVPLLIAYGVFTQEEGQLWESLILAIAAAIVPIVVTQLVKNYNDNSASIQMLMIEQETARIQAGRE